MERSQMHDMEEFGGWLDIAMIYAMLGNVVIVLASVFYSLLTIIL